ncbi:MAG: helix-turn-helix domain-containing protein [Lachnospiraceae bacterium]
MNDTIGKKIADLRKRKGITQDMLADAMGVSSQAVSKWENELSCPDISILPQLADYFGVTVDALLRSDKLPEVMVVPASERKDINKVLLKVRVLSSEGDKVNINLPVSLIKLALETGVSIPQLSVGSMDAIKNIDINAVIMMAEKGIIGKLIEVESAEGDIVEIYIE